MSEIFNFYNSRLILKREISVYYLVIVKYYLYYLS